MTCETTGKTNRINPDSIQALWLTVALVGFLAVASFMVSFTGLHEVASWAGLPSWLRWAVPVFIDVAILAYTLAVLIHRHRGEKTWLSWVSLAGFTLFSMVANAAHALALDHPDSTQQIIGAAVAALAPVSVFTATEQLGRLVIRHPATADVSSVLVGGPIGGPNGDGIPAIRADKSLVIPVQEAAGTNAARRAPVQIPTPVKTAESVAVEPAAVPQESKQEPATNAAGAEPTLIDAQIDVAPKSGSLPKMASHHENSQLAEPTTSPSVRPWLSVVGRESDKPSSLADWVVLQVAEDTQPTGKTAAEFLGVSERTGRRNLTELKEARPELFDTDVLMAKDGSNR